jgi:hypothetical protein
VNGLAQVSSNFRHAGELPSSVLADLKTTLEPLLAAKHSDVCSAAVRYLTGLPANEEPTG